MGGEGRGGGRGQTPGGSGRGGVGWGGEGVKVFKYFYSFFSPWCFQGKWGEQLYAALLATVQPGASLTGRNLIKSKTVYVQYTSGNVLYRNSNTSAQQYMNRIVYCGVVCSEKRNVNVY